MSPMKYILFLFILINPFNISGVGAQTDNNISSEIISIKDIIELFRMESNSQQPDISNLLILSNSIIEICTGDCTILYKEEIVVAHFIKASLEQDQSLKQHHLAKCIEYCEDGCQDSSLSYALNSAYTLSTYCEISDYQCLESYSQKCETLYKRIHDPTVDDKFNYYWSQAIWAMADVKFNDGAKILNYSKDLLAEQDKNYIYQKANILSALIEHTYKNYWDNYYYGTPVSEEYHTYADELIKITEGIELNDLLNRFLGFANFVKGSFNSSVGKSSVDSIYLKNSIKHYKAIKEKTIEDTIKIAQNLKDLCLILNNKSAKNIYLLEILDLIKPIWFCTSDQSVRLYFSSLSDLVYMNAQDDKKMANQYFQQYQIAYSELSSKNCVSSERSQLINQYFLEMKRILRLEEIVIDDNEHSEPVIMGSTLYRLGLNSDAQKLLTEAYHKYLSGEKELKTSLDSLTMYGILADLGTISKQTHWHWKALKVAPYKSNTREDGISRVIQTYDELIRSYLENNKIDSAEICLNIVNEYLDKNNVEDHGMKIFCKLTFLDGLNRFQECVDLGEKYIKKSVFKNDNNFNPNIYFGLIRSHIALGDMRRALDIALLITLDELNANNMSFHFMLSYYLSFTNLFFNVNSSLDYWRDLISIDLAQDILHYQHDINTELIEEIKSYLNHVIKSINAGKNSIQWNEDLYIDLGTLERVNVYSTKILLGKYDALLTLDSDSQQIKIELQNEKGTILSKKLDSALFFEDSEINGRKIWKEFDKELKGIYNIYVVTKNEFDFVNFGSIQDEETGLTVNNLYNILRIQEANNLTTYFNEPKIISQENFNITIVGSPAFSEDDSYLQRSFGSITRGRKEDSKWVHLEYARAEIENISNLLTSFGYKVNLSSEENASESYFRNLSNPHILHIATHGFIDDSTSDIKYGIVLAGANDSDEMPEENDGYLYADDIENLDLEHTKLAVVSACESAIYKKEGDRNITEALFKAGVDHQLVSLWKIDDEATKDLMISFYNNLAQTKNIRYAYNLAQNFMREKYKDPFYWASFILISQDLNYELH